MTTLPWGIDFGDSLLRHPTQLYEIVFLVILGCAIATYFMVSPTAYVPNVSPMKGVIIGATLTALANGACFVAAFAGF